MATWMMFFAFGFFHKSIREEVFIEQHIMRLSVRSVFDIQMREHIFLLERFLSNKTKQNIKYIPIRRPKLLTACRIAMWSFVSIIIAPWYHHRRHIFQPAIPETQSKALATLATFHSSPEFQDTSAQCSTAQAASIHIVPYLPFQ